VQNVLAMLTPYIHRFGYLAIVGAIFLEDFGVPLPGEALLIAGALLATQDKLNIVLLVVSAWGAAILGDNVGYLIGRAGGRRLVLRYGKYVLVTPERLGYAERFFHRHGAVVVIVARFFEILRQLNGIIAGIAKMPWWRFFLFNAVGAALWVGFWSTLFFQLGNRGESIGDLYHRYEPYVLVAGGVALAAFVLFRLRRNKKHSERVTEDQDETRPR
jgi:membrane protein DedA with SNARE-associated domain